MDIDDTIFAVATARGRAGVAVVRVSGRLAHDAVRLLVGDLPAPRRTALRHIRDPKSGEVIDQALVLIFEDGKSFTGENASELHCHGSTAVLTKVLSMLGEMPGLRLAEAGEFSRRALENGRLDLPQIEGLGDLIAAETESQRRAAVRVMDGELSRRVQVWRQSLLRIAALQAAMIDFADEDVPDLNEEVINLIQKVNSELRAELAGSDARERLRDGFEVAIVGRPNVGKSTLLNALAGRQAALTSEIAGTTRDVIEVRMDLSGLPVTLLDTAGIRDTTDMIELMGVELARVRAEKADLRVFLLDPGEAGPTDTVAFQPGDIKIQGKADLATSSSPDSLSGKTGEGVDRLLDRVTGVLSDRLVGTGITIRQRHRVAIQAAFSGLESAMERVKTGIGSEDIAAEEVLAAVRSLDSVIGRVDVEQILGEIFASFCIGK